MKYFVLLLLPLTACISHERLAAIQTAQETAQCEDLGFKQGTEKFAECRLSVRMLGAQQQTANAANAANAQNAYWNTYNAATRNNNTSVFQFR